MKEESARPSKLPRKSTMTLEQALATAELTQIIRNFKKLSDEDIDAKWKVLPPEVKEKVIAAARDSHSKKATEQRVALAHAIAVADADAAISLLQQALADTAQVRQTIGKIWFVESRGWIALSVLNIEEADGILHALIDIASDSSLVTEMKNKTKGGYASADRKLYDFSRWAMHALARLPEDKGDKQGKVQRLIALSRDWPEEWRNEVKCLADAASISLNNERENPSHPPDAMIAQETKDQASAPEATDISVEIGNQSPETYVQNAEILEPEEVPSPPEEDLLSDQARRLIKLREEEIAQKQAEAATLTSLVETLRTTREENAKLKRSLSDEVERFAGLQNSIARLEKRLTCAERLQVEAETRSGRLNEETERLKRELAAERVARADDQQLITDQVQRRIGYELSSFKERLANKLSQVFIQKSYTDSRPADVELVEFLRHWFQDLKEKLREEGVLVQRD